MGTVEAILAATDEEPLFAQDADRRPEEKPQGPGAADDELIFEGWSSRRLQEAMRIARTILHAHTNATGCRLVSRRGDSDAVVYASDSHRLAQVRINDLSRSTKSASFDVALPAQAVHALAQGVAGPEVRIRSRNGDAVIEHAQSDEKTVYPQGRALRLETFEKVLDASDEAFERQVIEMDRAQALKVLRANGPDREENPYKVSRMQAGADGLRIWASHEWTLAHETGNGWLVAGPGQRSEEPIVFGIRHPRLIDTLRTMTGKRARMSINTFRTALRLENENGTEQFLLMPARLNGREPVGA